MPVNPPKTKKTKQTKLMKENKGKPRRSNTNIAQKMEKIQMKLKDMLEVY
jgi:hypothetical protein